MPNSELRFFNSLSGSLKVDLTDPAQPIADLLNVSPPPSARVVKVELGAEVFNQDTKEFRPLTPEELGSIAFRAGEIRLRGESGEIVTHHAPNGTFFTVEQLLEAVEETERQTRSESEWFGGVDVHHVFFEGIHPSEDEDGVWDIGARDRYRRARIAHRPQTRDCAPDK